MSTDYEKVMGYLVADTELALARDNIFYVMAAILDELSFFGFTREQMEEGRKKLDASLSRIDAGSCYSLEGFRERLAFKPEKKDEQAERLKSEVRMAEYRFYEYCRRREVMQVRELIQTERHQL